MKTNETAQGMLEILTSVRSLTTNYKIISYFARIMWWFLELACYLLAALTVLFAFAYVTPGIEVKNEDITVTVSNESIDSIVYAIRFFLILIAAFMLIPGLLIRKIRKKNKQIEKVHDLVAGYLSKMKLNEE